MTRFRDVAKGAADDGAVVIDGVHLLLDALRAGVPVEIVLATSDLLADASMDVVEAWELARAADVPVHEATTGVIEAASPVRTPVSYTHLTLPTSDLV